MILNCRRDSDVKMMRSEEGKSFLSFRDPLVSNEIFSHERERHPWSGMHARRG